MIMETYTMAVIACTSVAFVAIGIYLHFLRKKSENALPGAPFVNPPGKRKPRRKKR